MGISDKLRDWLLLGVSTAATIAIALGLIRWYAPNLLGIPADLQLVRTAETLSPFYEGVFRAEDYQSDDLIFKDPGTRVRARPLLPDLGSLGPNDVLGFRNRSIPNTPDIITIGDSQTYGNNAPIDLNWPGRLRRLLSDRQAVTYNMSTGGWTAVQYLEMFGAALLFQPKVVIVAFYTGNDPLEAFSAVYGIDKWQGLIPDDAISISDRPTTVYPAPESEWWAVSFNDGVQTVFTPTLRLSSNLDHPAVRAGYRVMADVASTISATGKRAGIQIIFTIVPTKELVYSLKVEAEQLEPPLDYLKLKDQEHHYIERFAAELGNLPGATYVDIVRPMQEAALGSLPLYPDDINGHPVSAGYKIIAETIATELKKLLPVAPRGLAALMFEENRYEWVLVSDEGVRTFASGEVARANGWPPGETKSIYPRDVAGLPRLGIVHTVDPARFGPAAFGQ